MPNIFPNFLLHRGKIFGPNKIPNHLTNWMCRRRFSFIKGQYLAQIKIQIVKQIGCVDAASPSIFYCNLVIIESICYSRHNFFLRSSHIRADLLLCESILTDKREQYDFRAEKIWTGTKANRQKYESYTTRGLIKIGRVPHKCPNEFRQKGGNNSLNESRWERCPT